jgi:hypothetical protein
MPPTPESAAPAAPAARPAAAVPAQSAASRSAATPAAAAPVQPPTESTEAKVVMGETGPAPGQTREHLMIPPSSPRIGLDIDLDATEQPPATGELPPLDFDISGFEQADTEDPKHKR